MKENLLLLNQILTEQALQPRFEARDVIEGFRSEFYSQIVFFSLKEAIKLTYIVFFYNRKSRYNF